MTAILFSVACGLERFMCHNTGQDQVVFGRVRVISTVGLTTVGLNRLSTSLAARLEACTVFAVMYRAFQGCGDVRRL